MPKPAGAIATPHGAFKLPPVTTRETKLPLTSKAETKPVLVPRTSRYGSATPVAKGGGVAQHVGDEYLRAQDL